MSRGREIRDFLVHLRLHYQLFILPAGFLLGALYQALGCCGLNLGSFFLQFFCVHVLLNGGVTAYNSYHDKDEGPIGGIERPPPLAGWTGWAAIGLQFLGLLLGAHLGFLYIAIYATTMVLSICYSRRPPRWKGRPLASLVAVGIGTGTNTFLLGYLASGNAPFTPVITLAAFGVAAMLLSLYPISQIYQVEADRKNGDRTFAAAYGLRGVRIFYVGAYLFGACVVTATLFDRAPVHAQIFAGLSVIGGTTIYFLLVRLRGERSEYKPVMRLKYFASLLFTIAVGAALIAAQP